jgi:hypothetical protein
MHIQTSGVKIIAFCILTEDHDHYEVVTAQV